MKLLYVLGVFLVLGMLYQCQSGRRLGQIIGTGPQLILSVGEENPATNPQGTSDVKLTITDDQGSHLRYQKYQLTSPGAKVFKLNPGELVAQLDVKTPDQMNYRLRYPKLDSPLILENYYANWFGDQDSNWANTWCNEALTGSC